MDLQRLAEDDFLSILHFMRTPRVYLGALHELEESFKREEISEHEYFVRKDVLSYIQRGAYTLGAGVSGRKPIMEFEYAQHLLAELVRNDERYARLYKKHHTGACKARRKLIKPETPLAKDVHEADMDNLALKSKYVGVPRQIVS